MHRIVRNAAFAAIAVIAAAPAFAADAPARLGTFRSWTAYSVDTGGKACYAMSVPTSILPANANRDPIFFLVTSWTGRRVKNEPEIVPGYKYREGSAVTAEIAGARYNFFTQNDGNSGGAWVQTRGDETALIDAMSRGAQMVVTGTSTRGTVTRDTYSLSGFADALAAANAACGM